MDTVIKAVMLSGCGVGRAVGICADDIESSYVGDTSMIHFNLYAGFIFNAIYNYFNGLNINRAHCSKKYPVSSR